MDKLKIPWAGDRETYIKEKIKTIFQLVTSI